MEEFGRTMSETFHRGHCRSWLPAGTEKKVPGWPYSYVLMEEFSKCLWVARRESVLTLSTLEKNIK